MEVKLILVLCKCETPGPCSGRYYLRAFEGRESLRNRRGVDSP